MGAITIVIKTDTHFNCKYSFRRNSSKGNSKRNFSLEHEKTNKLRGCENLLTRKRKIGNAFQKKTEKCLDIHIRGNACLIKTGH